MVGILLALQVNNWNEWRKDRITETKVLSDLVTNLERNHDLIENTLTFFNSIERSKDIVMNAMENKLPYSDSLNIHFHVARRRGVVLFIMNRDGYEALKNTGFDILSNESLKNEIIYLFEVIYRDLDRTTEWALDVGERTRAQMSNYFYYSGKEDVFVPIDYDQLLISKDYISLLNEIAYSRNYVRTSMISSMEESKKVLEQISKELEQN